MTEGLLVETVEVTASDGVRLAAHRSGAGPALYAVHGGPATDSSAFGRYLDPIAAYRQLHLLDQRGCGESADAPVETYRLDRLALDVEEMRAFLGHERVDVVGHSFGCSVALSFALRWPGSVRAVVLVDGLVRGWRGVVASPVAWPLWVRAFATGLRGAADVRDFHLKHEVANVGATEEVRALLASQGRYDPVRVRPLSQDAARPMDPRPLLAAGVPVLAICGKQDRRFVGDVGFLRSLGARAALIEGAGHFPFVERHHVFHEILREFLESEGARSREDGGR